MMHTADYEQAMSLWVHGAGRDAAADE